MTYLDSGGQRSKCTAGRRDVEGIHVDSNRFEVHHLVLILYTLVCCLSCIFLCYSRCCLHYLIVRSPVLWTVDLMFCACFFLFYFSQLTFSDVCKPTFSKLFHMTWLYSKKKRCYADFLKVPPYKKWGAKNPKFRPILRLIATYFEPLLVMWKENRKSKTIMFASDY